MNTYNYKSMFSFVDDVRSKIQEGQLDLALRMIHDVVERIITEPLCTSQVYGSQGLDQLCQEIGSRSLSEHAGSFCRDERQDPQSVFAYVVTKLQKSGGHTHVIRDFIKARPHARHVVLSTELAGASDKSYVMHELGMVARVSFEAPVRGGFVARLSWLQRRLVEIGPDRTYLFNHHQDSVAAAAIQPEMGLNASFYHHGDHHLCLGVYLSHLEHIDPHTTGYHHCRDTLGIDNCYVPLTVNDSGDRPDSIGFMKNGNLTTCTAARSNKIEIPYFISYLDVIPKLLNATGGTHVHIGRLTPSALHRIRRGLKLLGINKDRFIYCRWTPSVWKALHKYGVDLYVASFPYGGILTMIEAMGAGVPVALHHHMYSRVLSGVDIGHPAAFGWRYPEELVAYCVGRTPDKLAQDGRDARAHYERFHRSEILEERLNGREVEGGRPPALKSGFSPEPSEWVVWAEKQLSCRRVVRRAAYRLFRNIRRKWL